MRSRRCDRAEGGSSSTASLIGLFNGSALRPLRGVSGRAQSSSALRGPPAKSAESRSLDAGEKRGGLEA